MFAIDKGTCARVGRPKATSQPAGLEQRAGIETPPAMENTVVVKKQNLTGRQVDRDGFVLKIQQPLRNLRDRASSDWSQPHRLAFVRIELEQILTRPGASLEERHVLE